jgi:hypothetical protein
MRHCVFGQEEEGKGGTEGRRDGGTEGGAKTYLVDVVLARVHGVVAAVELVLVLCGRRVRE